MASKAITGKYILSDEFQDFMGKKAATRGEVIKAVSAHIRDTSEITDNGKRLDPVMSELLQRKAIRRQSDVMVALKEVGAFQELL